MSFGQLERRVALDKVQEEMGERLGRLERRMTTAEEARKDIALLRRDLRERDRELKWMKEKE